MYQPTLKKERSRLASFTAPPNMLSFRTPSTLPATPSSNHRSRSTSQSQAQSSNDVAGAADPVAVSSASIPSIASVLSSPLQPSSSSSNSAIPSTAATSPTATPTKQARRERRGSQLQTQTQTSTVAEGINTTQSSFIATPSFNPPMSPTRTAKQPQTVQHSKEYGVPAFALPSEVNILEKSLPTAPRDKVVGDGPVQSLVPAPPLPPGVTLNNPTTALTGDNAQLPPARSMSPVPISMKAPENPLQAPGVTFRAALRPPAVAQVPDIPYGPGQGMRQRTKKTRQPSVTKSAGEDRLSTTAAATSSTTTGEAKSTSKTGAKQFTPSPVSTGLRLPSEAEATAASTAGNTARNAAPSYGNTKMSIVSGPAVQTGHMFVPTAPLTVNAPAVTQRDYLVTPLDPQALEQFHRDHPEKARSHPPTQQEQQDTAAAGVMRPSTPPNVGPSSTPSSAAKSPPKSALKNTGRSWADLVRPINNFVIAGQAVRNVGLSPEVIEQEAAKKKRVSIALPADSPTEAEHSLHGSGQTVPHRGDLTKVRSGSAEHTAQGNDKTPRHVSPPPPEHKELPPVAESSSNGVVDASHKHERSPSKAGSVVSNASNGSMLFSSIIAKKRTLGEILYGVESSSSGVVLYPRGLVNTGNACFMNSILQVLLFTAPFYNLISLIGLHTSEDLGGKTPLLDAMVGYLQEFKTSQSSNGVAEKENHIKAGETYEEQVPRDGDGAFIPNVIYHALNRNARFAQMGFYNPSTSSHKNSSILGTTSGSQTSSTNGYPAGGSHSRSASRGSAIGGSSTPTNNYLSQEDAQEFLGFFLDTLHEELLIKTEQHDRSNWEKASKGFKQGIDILNRQSVNGAADYAASIQSQPSSSTHTPSAHPAEADAEDWLEVGSKGRTATTRTTQSSESAITKIFGGQLRSVLRRSGQKDSVTLEPYISLQLEIQAGQITSVADALAYISQPESLSDVTNRDNVKMDAIKQVYIETLPPVLILHLKRFVYDARAGGVLKSHKAIAYDTELEIPRECLSPVRRATMTRTRYRLTGVVYHHGKSASGGHYTVAVRQNNGRWLGIDDTLITPMTAEDATVDLDREKLRLSLPSASRLQGIPDKSAYLLFYQRI